MHKNSRNTQRGRYIVIFMNSFSSRQLYGHLSDVVCCVICTSDRLYELTEFSNFVCQLAVGSDSLQLVGVV